MQLSISGKLIEEKPPKKSKWLFFRCGHIRLWLSVLQKYSRFARYFGGDGRTLCYLTPRKIGFIGHELL